MKLTLKEIAQKIDGEILGDETLEIYGVSSFYDAQPYDITFASDPKFLKSLDKTRASAVIVPEYFTYNAEINNLPASNQFDGEVKNSFPLALIKTQNPKRKFFGFYLYFIRQKSRLKPLLRRVLLAVISC